VTAFGCLGENCREAAIQNSPGLQPWVNRVGQTPCLSAIVRGNGTTEGKWRPMSCVWQIRVLFHHRAQHRVPLFRLRPITRSYGGQAGHLCQRPDPGLKPWAVLYSRFAAKSDEPLRNVPIFLVARRVDRAHHRRMAQSIRNRIPGTIREITSDPVLSEVVLDTTIGPVAAVITTRSLKELGLKVGDSAYGLVKATNVSIEKE
jgi:molybdopterin-binding protein